MSKQGGDLYHIRVADTSSNVTNGRVEFELSDGTFAELSSTTDVKDGEWHHIVGLRSGSTGRLYINGVEEDTNTVTTGEINPSASFEIGRHSGGTEYFSGQLDDIRVYKYALTAEQVQILYGSGTVRYGPETGSP